MLLFNDIPEFKKRLRHNVATLKKHIMENRFCANDYHFLDHTKELNHFLASRKFFDIVASTIIGGLPIDQMSGVDCYRYSTKKGFEAVEVKLIEIHTRGAFKTDRGAIYYGKQPTINSNKRNSIRSHFRARFEIVNNLKEKNIPTIVVLFDTEKHQIIDAIEMCGKDVLFYLTNVVDAQGNILQAKCTKKRTIALSAFLKHGKKVQTKIPVIGFEIWEQSVKEMDIPVITYPQRLKSTPLSNVGA